MFAHQPRKGLSICHIEPQSNPHTCTYDLLPTSFFQKFQIFEFFREVIHSKLDEYQRSLQSRTVIMDLNHDF